MKSIMESIKNITKEQWFDVYLRHSTGEQEDLVPFPEEDVQVLTNGQKGLVTAKGAVQIFSNLFDSIKEYISIEPNHSVLDYGCGWGRITRLLPYYVNDENVYGVDVDGRLISSAKDCVPTINFQEIVSMGTLPFGDAMFDLVFANSVFSHLSEQSALSTLSELSRITKKGGVVVISVLEISDMEKFYLNNEQQRQWIEKILGDFETAKLTLAETGFIWGDTGRWDDYGIAIMKNDWIDERFNENSLTLVDSTKTDNPGSQNYKVGIKK